MSRDTNEAEAKGGLMPRSQSSDQESTTPRGSNSAPLSTYDTADHTTCDNCGRNDIIAAICDFPGDEPTQKRYFIIPSEYEHVCRRCFEDVNEHTPGDLTDDELIAGIISDSYGYAGPKHAQRHVDEFRNGETTCRCERGTAQLDNDLEQLMEAARRRWLTRSPDEKEALLKLVAEWRDIEQDDAVAGLEISMSYPTLGL